MPGTYKVTWAKRVQGVTTPLPGEQEFKVEVEGGPTMDVADRKALFAFQAKVARLQRAVAGTLEAANAVTGRLEQVKRALDQTPSVAAKWRDVAQALEKKNRAILQALRGDVVLRGRNENTPESIVERVFTIVAEQRFSLAKPTATQEEGYAIASQEFAEELAQLRQLIEVDLRGLEKALDAAGAPWTPGRLPEWPGK
jgi:hypothetical protein